MVTELQDLLRRNVEGAPPDHVDLAEVVATGRRRVRRRRAAVAGAGALATAAAVALTAVSWPTASNDAGPASPPRPDAPTIRLDTADQAVQGRDYDVVTSYTNKNLDKDNGQYFEGETDDGLILFKDGPRSDQLYPRFALMNPETGQKDWLPRLHTGQTQTWPLELGADRLVLLGSDQTVHVFDRTTRQWSTPTWPDLPRFDDLRAYVGPDERLYVQVEATKGRIPEGGWPTTRGGDADDSNAEGDTYHLWSASLTDPDDVRDEQLTVGSIAFTESQMAWTDSTNGAAGMVHVRDLATGAEHSFDPHLGDKCNLLGFGLSGERIVMSEYCGTYGRVRDDRVQILTTGGDQVTTIQDSGIDGSVSPGSDVVAVQANRGDDQTGTYAYDLTTDRFLRITDDISHWGTGGPALPGELFWHTPVNGGHGATWWLGRLLD